MIWGNRSKNKPPYMDFAPFVDNMAQEPDRYRLPDFRGAHPRFGPLTRVGKSKHTSSKQHLIPPSGKLQSL